MPKHVDRGPWKVGKYERYDKRIPIVTSGMEDAPPLAWVDNDDTANGPGNAELLCQAVNDKMGWK